MPDDPDVGGAPDVPPFGPPHPRREFVFRPEYAAHLDLIEPWRKVLKSLALKGRRSEADRDRAGR